MHTIANTTITTFLVSSAAMVLIPLAILMAIAAMVFAFLPKK